MKLSRGGPSAETIRAAGPTSPGRAPSRGDPRQAEAARQCGCRPGVTDAVQGVAREHGRGHRDHRERHEEEAAEPIDAEGRRERAAESGAAALIGVVSVVTEFKLSKS